MSVLLAEMTREEIRNIAAQAVAVLPTAAIEQHGPHLPICTDTLICETVARRSAERTAGQAKVAVAPIQCYGNSHHHFPFPGVLSLTSQTFMAAVTDLLESLVRSGFRRLVLLNGHGGNTEINTVIGQDMVNRLGHPISIATVPYWDIARATIVESGLITSDLIPGHAGHFETSLVMALRPDLVHLDALSQSDTQRSGIPYKKLPSGIRIAVHGIWEASGGYTDDPATASAEKGQAYLDIIVEQVAGFLMDFHQSS